MNKEKQKEYNKKYRQSLHYKQVVFYKHEKKLADFADRINFQGLIKDVLSKLNENSVISIKTLNPLTNCFDYYMFDVASYLYKYTKGSE